MDHLHNASCSHFYAICAVLIAFSPTGKCNKSPDGKTQLESQHRVLLPVHDEERSVTFMLLTPAVLQLAAFNVPNRTT